METVESPLVMQASNEVLRSGDLLLCLEPGFLRRGAHDARFVFEGVVTDEGREVVER